MKEIDQKNENRLLIECSCGHHHFICFSFDEYPEKWDELDEETKKNYWKSYYVSFVDQRLSFWSRIKEAWDYIFGNKREICYPGIMIDSKDIDKIIEHFRKYQEL